VEAELVVQPLVSILINNYNYAQYLAEAIDSAVNQTYDHLEVIVVDDGSTDDSRAIMASYGDRIVAIYQPNQGQASAFNTGFAHSRGEIICFLDADDWFLPHKVATIVQAFQTPNSQTPDDPADIPVGWVFHPQQYFQVGPPLAVEHPPVAAPGVWHNLTALIQRGKLGNPFDFPIPATSAMCFRRELLQRILPMPEGEGISLSDSYIKFVALGLSPGMTINQDLTLQRLHGQNAFTGQNDRRQTAQIHVLMAYWMRQRFPQLTAFTNNLLAVGVKGYQKTGGLEPYYRSLIQEHLAALSLQQRLHFQMKVWFYTLKP
jgi:glycosyltransferase involved in cell wall biosynthesis